MYSLIFFRRFLVFLPESNAAYKTHSVRRLSGNMHEMAVVTETGECTPLQYYHNTH